MPTWIDQIDARLEGAEVAISGEAHTVGERTALRVYLKEAPKRGTLSLTINGGAATLVAVAPTASGQVRAFFSDEILGGRLDFHSSDAGKAVVAAYGGTGSGAFAHLINDLQDEKLDAEEAAQLFSDIDHTHVIAEVDGLQGALNAAAATGSSTTNLSLVADSDGNGSGEVLLKIGSATKARISNDGRLIQTVPATAYADASLGLNEVTPFFDAATGRLSFRVKRADGGVVTAVAQVGPGLTLLDTIVRPNSAASAGRADTGQLWEVGSGTWGVSSNQLYIATASGREFLVVDLGKATYSFSTTLAALGTGIGVVVRYTSTADFIVARIGGGALQLLQCSAFSFTQIGSGAVPVAGNKVTIEVTPTTVRVLVNDVQVIAPVSNSHNAAATKAGLYAEGGTASRWTNVQAL